MSLSSTTVLSQANITVGTPYPVVDALNKYYFYKDNQVLTVKIEKNTIFLQKMDTDKLTHINTIEYEDFPKGFELEKVMKYNNRFYFFYYLWDRPNQTEELYIREIDFKSGTFMGPGKRILAISKKIRGFSYNMSYGESKLLIQYTVKAETRNNEISHDIIGMNMFNENLELLWSKETTMPYTEKKMHKLDYSLDSEGNAYLLAKVFNDNTRDEKKPDSHQANYHIELLKIAAKTAEVKISQVDIDDKFIKDVLIYNGSTDYMLCAGYYNNGNFSDAVNGIILFKINKSGDIYDKIYHEFSTEIINQFSTKKNEAQLRFLDLREISIEKDGSIAIIGERYHVMHMKDSDLYYYGEIMITKIDPSGNLVWTKKLPKTQVGEYSKGGLSYNLLSEGDYYYFLFLDNEKNMNLSINENPAVHTDEKGGFLTAYKVGKNDGSISKVSILNTRDVNNIEVYQFATKRILYSGINEFVIEFYKKGKEDLLIKAKIK